MQRFAIAAALLLLGACAFDVDERPKIAQPLGGTKLLAGIADAKSVGLADPFIKEAVKALEQGDFVKAQAGFNRALKFDPSNAQLHFLNGLTYHLRAEAGDRSQLDLAETGYHLALQYDTAHKWAAYQLGHIKFSQQLYREAQEAFSYALLFDAENPTLLKALATASYYAQDLETASSAITKAEMAAPDDPGLLRTAALVSAATGRTDAARGYVERMSADAGAGRLHRVNYMKRRIDDWQRLHGSGGIQLAQSTSDILGGDNTTTGLSPSGDDSSDDSSDSSDSDSSSSASATKTKPPTPGMALVDVVIIRSEERNATDKGLNLLNGLTVTLSGNSFTYTTNRAKNNLVQTGSTSSTTITRNAGFSIPSITYSLNIFNDTFDRNEVLARPSLVALDGKTSQFFTGAVFHVELSGVAGSEGTVTDVPVGIKLDVTPKFLGADEIQLKVEAARAFIEGRSAQIGFNNFAQITKTSVTANVAMKFGDTLILSGLSEKETEKLNDGVPLLQDIPGLQYFFSHEDTLEFTKSVLILLTPRKPRYAYEDGTPKIDPANPPDANKSQPNLAELKERVDWFKPAGNLDAVFRHLKDRRLFKEFRTGDVQMESWNDRPQLAQRIIDILYFIYF